MISNLYSEYAKLEAEAKAIEEKKEQLRPHIIKMMIDAGEKQIDAGVGKFSLGVRRVWKYPEQVMEIGEQFKAAKAKAESTGDAEFDEFDQLRYTSAKL